MVRPLKSSSRHVAGALNKHPSLQAILAQGERILNADRLFREIAPVALTRISRVANLKSGILIIHARHGAAANKLRQMSRYLTDELVKRGVECNGIEVRVQDGGEETHLPIAKTKPISEQALTSLDRAAQKMSGDSPLRGRILHLIEHAARTPKGE